MNSNTSSKIQSLKIQNFHGIKLFELNTLGKINIFLGRNSVGKTTVLEALFLITGGSIFNISRLAKFRNTRRTRDPDFLASFYNLQPENQPKLACTIEDKPRTILIKPLSGFSDNAQLVLSSRQQIDGYEMELEIDNKKYTTRQFVDEEGRMPFRREISEVRQTHTAAFDSYKMQNASPIQALIRDGKKSELIEKLKQVIPSLESIEEIDRRFYATIKGAERLLPMELIGEGIVRIASMFSSLHISKDNFCLIDEIENGLHYRSQELMWEIICEQSLLENVDCFITSHSYEMIQTLCRFLQKEENEKYRDLVCVHTLIKKTDRLESVSYNFEEFAQEIKDKAEIRGLF